MDQRAATLVKRLKKRQLLQAVINAEGDVSVEGYFVGKLFGFSFIADATDSKVAGKAVTKAAFKALGQEIVCRAYTLINGPDDVFSLSDAGRLIWRESEVASGVLRRPILHCHPVWDIHHAEPAHPVSRRVTDGGERRHHAIE